eukprot:GHVH01003649.1.p1 GENE.GHVH01003649.1~~GHVH01003649.1.p1  ORF type:complete len:207 (+),score=15.39 GHVH01003649.1:80-700(+)
MVEIVGCRKALSRYWEGKNQKSRFLRCFPLAFCPLILGILWIAFGALDIAWKVIALSSSDSLTYSPSVIIMLGLNGLQIQLGIMSIYVSIRNNKVIRVLQTIKFCYLFVAFSFFVVQLILLISFAVSDVAYSASKWGYLIFQLVCFLLLIGLSYEVNGSLSSLRKVYIMGGTGWENQNAAEISTIHKIKLQDASGFDRLADSESEI